MPYTPSTLWNPWDSMGLMLGLTRYLNEDNVAFRRRIISKKDYSGSHQGMVNWLADSFAVTRPVMEDKLYIVLLMPPLSQGQFTRKNFKNDEYYYPRIVTTTAGVDTEYELRDVAGPDAINRPGETVVAGVTFRIWKDQVGDYIPLITTDKPWPTIKVRYLALTGQTYTVVEERES